jgi:hypothetical protein
MIQSLLTHLNLNVELVRRGLARVPSPNENTAHLRALQGNPAYARLISRLLMSEKVQLHSLIQELLLSDRVPTRDRPLGTRHVGRVDSLAAFAASSDHRERADHEIRSTRWTCDLD